LKFGTLYFELLV